jgi:hypothetical protein
VIRAESAFPVRRWLTVGVIALATAAAMLAGVAASNRVDQAHAFSSGNFCHLFSGSGYANIPAGSRCVDSARVRHRYVRADIWGGWGDGDYCVGAKQNADGTGGNTMGFGCAYWFQTSYTFSGPWISPGAPLGYATIINRTGESDLFRGYKQWYP